MCIHSRCCINLNQSLFFFRLYTQYKCNSWDCHISSSICDHRLHSRVSLWLLQSKVEAFINHMHGITAKCSWRFSYRQVNVQWWWSSGFGNVRECCLQYITTNEHKKSTNIITQLQLYLISVLQIVYKRETFWNITWPPLINDYSV